MGLTKSGAAIVLNSLSRALAGGSVSLYEGRPDNGLPIGEIPLATPALDVLPDGTASLRTRSGTERAMRDGRPDWVALRNEAGETLYMMPFGAETGLDRPLVEIGARLFLAEGIVQLPMEP